MKRLLHALDPRNATQAWLALLVITVVTAGIAVAERGVLPWVGWIIAALVWWKAGGRPLPGSGRRRAGVPPHRRGLHQHRAGAVGGDGVDGVAVSVGATYTPL